MDILFSTLVSLPPISCCGFGTWGTQYCIDGPHCGLSLAVYQRDNCDQWLPTEFYIPYLHRRNAVAWGHTLTVVNGRLLAGQCVETWLHDPDPSLSSCSERPSAGHHGQKN